MTALINLCRDDILVQQDETVEATNLHGADAGNVDGGPLELETVKQEDIDEADWPPPDVELPKNESWASKVGFKLTRPAPDPQPGVDYVVDQSVAMHMLTMYGRTDFVSPAGYQNKQGVGLWACTRFDRWADRANAPTQ